MKLHRFLFWLCVGLPAASGADAVEFSDPFDSQPHPSWHWLREAPKDWRIRDSALEICIQPGDANTVRNALVRPAPDRRQGHFAIELKVTNLTVPTQQFEQAGITWYTDGKPVFKLVKERVDGQLMIIPSRRPMTNETVQLRLIVSSNSWSASFRPNAAGEWQSAGSGELPAPNRDEVSVQGYHGPPDTNHWIRFDDFRILRVLP